MRSSRLSLSLCLAAALAGCGGSSAAPTAGTPTPSPAPSPSPSPSPSSTPTPTPTSAQCSLSSRQDWAYNQLDEWYLFPTLINQSANKAAYSDLQSYIDALVAPARAQSKDRYFTYVTSIAEENALINSGATAGFGFRLGYDTANRRVFIIESLEGAPALGQNIDRGDELLAIGTSGGSLQTVSSLMAAGGPQAVIDALGPSTAGVTRVLRMQDLGGPQHDVTLAKADYNLQPLSPRYGAKVIDNGGTLVGYVNLRTFIANTAKTQLKDAFQDFKNQGINQVVVDLRYNGGGLVSVSQLFADLLSASHVGEVLSHTTFRSSKSQYNETTNFKSQAEAIAAIRIAFIGTGSSASASELLMNTFPPYLANNVALIGSNTYGKPVGQIGLDLTACDDRLRVIAFKTDNADNEGEYFTGLADTMPVTCSAQDNISFQMGDPNESMTAAALNWLGGGSCTAIAGAGKTTQAVKGRRMLQPQRPSAAQHEVPGLF